MSLPLSELKKSADPKLAERVKKLCLAQNLVAEVESLEAERAEIRVEASRSKDADAEEKPRKMSVGNHPRLAEIDARLEELYDEMRDHTGELRLRARPSGDWMRWSGEHPAREDNQVDEQVTYGFVNADDLVNDLAAYAVEWDGSPLGDGDWDFIASRVTVGDLKELARTVVQMQEGAGAVPKSRHVSSSDQTSEAD